VDWVELTGRVLVEAASASSEDIVCWVGDPTGSDILAAKVRLLVRAPDAPGVSILVLHHWLRHHTPDEQRRTFARAAATLPERGLLLVGDVMWSLPFDQLDEPEQFGPELQHVQTTATLERWAREAGFLPDLHRFGPGVGVLVTIRGPK
jgi:hypothetical protein